MAVAYTHPFTIDSIAMSEGVVRRVLYQSLLALHHLHTAHGDRPVVVHRAISPEKRELRYPLTSQNPAVGKQIDSRVDGR
jgi:serine/threonine protein kinase